MNNEEWIQASIALIAAAATHLARAFAPIPAGAGMHIPAVVGRRFAVGKYEVVATPIPYSLHMLRYTVYLGGHRVGALASYPTESDCRFLEDPPPVPPLKIFSVMYRPGRPKKGSVPRTNDPPPPVREELPAGIELPRAAE